LFEVRSGFWNPNIFLGDIYGSLFIDHSELERNLIEEPLTVYGAELALETGFFQQFYLTPRIIWAQSYDEKEERIHIRLGGNF
jgi:hypothetical protein